MVGSRCGREPAQNYTAIIFVDQNGLSERPHRVRTWAPAGRPRCRNMTSTGKVLSATAGIVCRSFYFRLYSTYPQPAGGDFLGHLLRHFSAKLLVVWDGLPVRRAGVVSESIRAQRSRPAIERLLGYFVRAQPGRLHLRLLEASPATQLLPSDS